MIRFISNKRAKKEAIQGLIDEDIMNLKFNTIIIIIIIITIMLRMKGGANFVIDL